MPLPAESDGSQGLNRACLPARSGTAATVVDHRQAQAAVVAEHTDLPYINVFLSDPQPEGRRIGQGKAERFDPAWPPFTKPLPESSREIARKLLPTTCGWLVREQCPLVTPIHGLA